MIQQQPFIGFCFSSAPVSNLPSGSLPPTVLRFILLEQRVTEFPQRLPQIQDKIQILNVARAFMVAFHCRRCRFHLWVGKIPWRRKWQPPPVFFAWEIPWTEEPGELQSMWLQRVRHNLATKQQQINSRKSLLKFWDIMSLVMLILAFKSIMSL